ncbi:MAG: SLBB domain-containing protein [Bacteroidota bacterium]|nr:SLBB domain-containing protein [Bacteroidota bacterium]
MKSSFLKLQPFCMLILAVCFLILGSGSVQAQTVTPVIMAQINAELQKRGLTESEVRVRLLQKGIDLENIPPAELPQYQSRVIAVLDELQAEKKAGNATAQPIIINNTQPIPAGDNTQVQQNSNTEITEPVTTMQEAAAEASQRVVQAAVAKEGVTNIYGHSIFTDKTLDVFRTTDGAQAPETYVLGDGDEIRITIFGASQTDIQQKIALDGSIQPSGGSKIFLKGLTLAQAREVIKDRLSSSYTFRSDQLAVTIATARTIMVNVFGEAKITGGFTISALNSALNALSAAGGPTAIGSVRSIQLIRGETRKTIDIYSFMNDPAAQFRFDLQNNDIIFVPVVKLLVSIEGAVKRPMAYEMLPTETLTDLIRYAGDVNMNVFPDFVQIQRYVNGEQRLMEYNLEDIRSGKTKVPMLNGDIVRIKAIGKPMDRYVEVEGSVYYPGRYDLSANPTLGNLLTNARPTLQAKTDLIFIERIRPDLTVEQLSINWTELQNSKQEFKLNPRDRVRVAELANYRDIAPISVSGHVRNPFEKNFALTDRLTVKQAIEMAGGIKIDAYPIAYVLRYNLLNPKEKTYLRLELETSNDFVLLPGDQLNIFDRNTFTEASTISVNGQVRLPFEKTFALTDRITVKQAIELAGGLKNSVYPVAYIFRRNLLNPVEIKYIRIELNQSDNIELQPGDQLNIYDNTTYTNVGEVRVFGAVKKPGGFTYDPTLTVRDVITNAGGFNVGAAFNRVEVFRTILSPTEKTRLDLITIEVDSSYQVVNPQNFTLQPYDQVVVRLTPEFTLGRTVQISGQVKYPGTYVLESKQTQLSEIIKMAGGMLSAADPYGSSLFRTYHNRGNISMDLNKTMAHAGNLNSDPILFEGDVININRLENTVTIRENGTRMAQYSIYPENNDIKNVIYQGPKSARWYIRKFAGGFQKQVDRNSVTVTLPNNQMLSTERFLFFFRNYPNAKSGSMINMQMKPPKEKSVDGKKTDWDSIMGRTSTSITATLTLYLLIQQLTK